MLFSDPREDHPYSSITQCQGRINLERVPQQESSRAVGLPQRLWLYGDHDASIFQNYRMGSGKSQDLILIILFIRPAVRAYFKIVIYAILLKFGNWNLC